MANEATAKANALCPQRAVAPTPPPPPAVPTAAIAASPTTIQPGQCATLTWSATNATDTSLNHGLGAVAPSGSRQVCPTSTLSYLLTATGAGGVASEVATVTVTAPPPAAPTASLTASPTAIQPGQCTTLTWSATNATSTAIDQGIGSVAPSGSQQVCPTSPTSYVLTATGAGGSQTASTSVGVTAPPPPPPRRPVERLTLHINFDTNKATIRQDEGADLQKAVEFAKRYPDRKISIEGHTDNVGNAKYNQSLSERRAAAVKEYLLKNGVSGGERITTAGYGQTKPIADNATEKGRSENRRVEIVVLP